MVVARAAGPDRVVAEAASVAAVLARVAAERVGHAAAASRKIAAIREILEAPDRLTITRADSMVIFTTGDGRTTRLSTDGKAVKDESTKIERKTRPPRE